MKTLKSIIVILLIAQSVYAQDWNGANSTNVIWRVGKVGIGTDTPISPLSFGQEGSIYFPSKDGGSNYIVTNQENNRFNIEGSSGLEFWTHNNGWGTRMVISKNGNVGIGTTDPGSNKLSVKGNVLVDGELFTNNTMYQNINTGIRISDLGNKLIFWATANSTELHAAGDKGIVFKDNSNSEKMILTNSGCLGIGTLNPNSQYKLDVYGKIRAQEIVVDMKGAPDYVFEPTYRLRTIEEVDTYVQKNKHLPDIQSAKEFEKNGVAQSEMNKKLLQKIEELTLYVIQQNKETKAIKKETIELRKENEQLKKRIESLEVQ